jgi:hypothetical protein
MNFENMSAWVIRLLGAYQIFMCFDDIVYVLAKQATDPHFDSYHYYAIRIGGHIFMGLILFCLAVPLGKRIVKGLM